MTTAVTKVESLTPEPSAVLAVIARAAADPSVDVDKMDRLLQMQERVLARQAEVEFNAAMADAQSEIGRISADATNPQTRSNYATYGKLDKVLRPVYSRHGFALSFGEGESPKPDYVRVTCIVSHRAGHSRTYFRDMPADGKGAKGGDVMTKTHAAGAAQSYGMRYLLKGIFNVAIGEEDRDGNDSTDPTLTDKQAADLKALLIETNSDLGLFMQWCKVKSLDQILQKNFDYVCREVRNRAKARAGK
jgi:hypothetical protein